MKKEKKHVSDSNDLMNQHFYRLILAARTAGTNHYFELELREIRLSECNFEFL